MPARIIAVLCACALSVHLAGCAVPVAVAATAGLSAAQAGSSAWVNGELREAVFHDLDTVHRAALLAMDDLEVNVITDRAGERSARIMAKESGGPEIRVTLIRRTPHVTRIGIRVGLIGELSTSRVVLDRVYSHLPQQPSAEDVRRD